jgi:outer membrane protein TolC
LIIGALRKTINFPGIGMMMTRRLIQVLGVLWLASCTLIPVQQREKLETHLPEEFFAAGTPSADKVLLWQQSFPCPHLQRDGQILLETNFELAAARARVAQAAAAYGAATAARLPGIVVGLAGERADTASKGDTTRTDVVDFEVALNWELDIWGGLKARERASALKLQEGQALVDQIALDLQLLLVENWVLHQTARQLGQLLAAQREINAQLLELTAYRLAQGQGAAVDLLQQQRRLTASDRALPAVEARIRSAANAYAVLMGRLPDGNGLGPRELPTLTPLQSLTSPRRLLTDRPDLRAAFLALQAADQEVAAAIADRLPRLSIGFGYTESGNSLANLGATTMLNATAGLLAPVFDAGRLKAKVAQRAAKASESVAVLEQAMLEAIGETEDALLSEGALFEEYRLTKKELLIAQDTLRMTRMRYLKGQDNFLAVLLALNRLQNLQADEIRLQEALLINRSRLLRAIGAKWRYPA